MRWVCCIALQICSAGVGAWASEADPRHCLQISDMNAPAFYDGEGDRDHDGAPSRPAPAPRRRGIPAPPVGSLVFVIRCWSTPTWEPLPCTVDCSREENSRLLHVWVRSLDNSQPHVHVEGGWPGTRPKFPGRDHLTWLLAVVRSWPNSFLNTTEGSCMHVIATKYTNLIYCHLDGIYMHITRCTKTRNLEFFPIEKTEENKTNKQMEIWRKIKHVNALLNLLLPCLGSAQACQPFSGCCLLHGSKACRSFPFLLFGIRGHLSVPSSPW